MSSCTWVGIAACVHVLCGGLCKHPQNTTSHTEDVWAQGWGGRKAAAFAMVSQKLFNVLVACAFTFWRVRLFDCTNARMGFKRSADWMGGNGRSIAFKAPEQSVIRVVPSGHVWLAMYRPRSSPLDEVCLPGFRPKIAN